jgi:hypothetical protein
MIHHFKWTAVSADTYYSDTFYPQRLKDEAGILELHEISGAATIRIQGQLHEDGTWRNLGSDQTASGYESGIPVFPSMRIKVVTTGGSTTLSANFAE